MVLNGQLLYLSLEIWIPSTNSYLLVHYTQFIRCKFPVSLFFNSCRHPHFIRKLDELDSQTVQFLLLSQREKQAGRH
mgnify:CR=1 FL=1